MQLSDDRRTVAPLVLHAHELHDYGDDRRRPDPKRWNSGMLNRSTLLLWDDVLKEGRPKLDTAKFAAVYDAMGNRLSGTVELTMVPVFVLAEGEDAPGLRLDEGLRGVLLYTRLANRCLANRYL